MSKRPTKPAAPDGAGLIAHDSWLEPHAEALRTRYRHVQRHRERIENAVGSLKKMALGHHYFGLNRGKEDGQEGVWYREWAPAATYVALVGDFNGWDRGANPLTRDEFGVWSVFLPDAVYAGRLVHGSLLKVHVAYAGGAMDRIPAYATRVVQTAGTVHFNAQYWCPPAPYTWQHRRPVRRAPLRIYEAHVGMAAEAEKVGTYAEFTRDVLPRIADLGYNAVQLMAIQEHPYYGSFGYHVSSFFAPSSRFGTPEELMALIDTAHGLGLQIFLDIVHSHAVKNLHEGLGNFDGSGHQYFHGGGRGQHPAWDSLCFDYGVFEVQRFLLSNLRYWLEDFRFDGFRFDGVTSMLYHDHGMGKSFGSYDDYFGPNVDLDAYAYLCLANEVAHAVHPATVTIAEDMSGMVGIARPLEEGGLGFDYRLAMGIPDFWIKLLKERRDEDWNMHELWGTLMNRRFGEAHVAYAESHDQALVGDKTLAFWLMDADMYWHMNLDSQSPVIDRGMAMHKVIRLLTFSLGGEAYLTFMGNEFGHPEWVDFPREGNGYSYKHARRQWSLADAPYLRYHFLRDFDAAMMNLDDQYRLLEDGFIEQLAVDEERKLLVYRRGPLVFVANLNPTASFHDHRIPVPDRADYRLRLSTDDRAFGGFGNVAGGQRYVWQDVGMYGRDQSLLIYVPARSMLVLAPDA